MPCAQPISGEVDRPGSRRMCGKCRMSVGQWISNKLRQALVFSRCIEHLPSKTTLGKEQKDRQNGILLSANSLTSPPQQGLVNIFSRAVYTPLPPNVASGCSLLGFGPPVFNAFLTGFGVFRLLQPSGLLTVLGYDSRYELAKSVPHITRIPFFCNFS